MPGATQGRGAPEFYDPLQPRPAEAPLREQDLLGRGRPGLVPRRTDHLQVQEAAQGDPLPNEEEALLVVQDLQSRPPEEKDDVVRLVQTLREGPIGRRRARPSEDRGPQVPGCGLQKGRAEVPGHGIPEGGTNRRKGRLQKFGQIPEGHRKQLRRGPQVELAAAFETVREQLEQERAVLGRAGGSETEQEQAEDASRRNADEFWSRPGQQTVLDPREGSGAPDDRVGPEPPRRDAGRLAHVVQLLAHAVHN